MQRRRACWFIAAALQLPGCLLRRNRSVGPFFAVKLESVPADVEVTQSDDPRIADVWLIQDVLRMVEEERFTGHDLGGGNWSYIDYNYERDPGRFRERFNEAADALDGLPYTESRPIGAEGGPLPDGYYIAHHDCVVAIEYGRPE